MVVALLIILSWSTAYNNELQKATGYAVLGNESLKETFQKDKEFLEKRYADLKFENDELRKQKDVLEAESSRVSNDLADTKSKFNILEKRFKELQDNLIKANEDIGRLIARNNELCRKLKEKGEEC